jgi:hypothetical protein
MNKAYLVAPLLSVVIFGAIYRPLQRDYDQRLATEAQHTRDASDARARQQLAAQAAAQKAAALAMEQRARERAEREALETAQRTAHTEAEQRRLDAFTRLGTLRLDVARVRRERDDETAAVTLLERKKVELQQEQALVAAQLYQAETSRRTFLDVTEKVDAQAGAAVPVDSLRTGTPRTLNARHTP